MFNAFIAFSLRNRLLVIALTLLVAGLGGYWLQQSPVDVFPELNRPTVTIMTEFHGRAPEEVERLVTFPLEAALNGATGVERVRSASTIGLSVVDVEFAWNTDVHLDQQIVAQRLRVATLPEKVQPVIMPPSSLMGEIMLVGLESTTGAASPMELRTLADWVIRPRLLTVRGVAQVRVMGGVIQQFQVLTDPARLALHDVTLEELTRAVEKAVPEPTGGGVLLSKNHETLIRIGGRALSPDELAQSVVTTRNGIPVRIRQVADVVFAGPVPRGDGAVWLKDQGAQVVGGSAVIVDIDKQPGANTIEITRQLDVVLRQLEHEIRQTHPDIRLHTSIFRQAYFIRSAIDNVAEAVRDGILLLALILFLFLWNFRTGFITLLVLPLPLALLGLLFSYFGLTLNTMTLGGIAIAIGDLVDDSIVDIENIYRRLKENRQCPKPLPALRVVFEASAEVRNSIVYATLIVCLVVCPLFFLSGLEGRMFTPMGLAYIVTLLASLLVSLTITPVLASLMLPRARFLDREGDSFLVRTLKGVFRPILRWTLRHPWKVIAASAFMAPMVLLLFLMGGQFLPKFNEGTFTINLRLSPGTSMAETNRLAGRAAEMLFEIPEVEAVAARTGRAELDEHAEPVNSTDLEVRLAERWRPRDGKLFELVRHFPLVGGLGWEKHGRSQEAVESEIRELLSVFPGVDVDVGQPISHRLDHIMSGVQAQIAIKIFGPNLHVLRSLAADVEQAIHEIPGVVDLRVEQLDEIDQVRINVLHNEAARYGRSPAEVAQLLETAFRGRTIAQVIEPQRVTDVVVWFSPEARNDLDAIRSTLVDTPLGRVPLRQLSDVEAAGGPLTINRENVQRRIVVSCNTEDRDLASVVADIQTAITERVEPELASGYFIEFGGQFEAQQEASFRIVVLFPVVVLGIFLLLCRALESWRAALQVLLVTFVFPLPFIGAVVALLIANPPTWEALEAAAWHDWPLVWVKATSLSLAHLIGFIALTGIATRNSIMMISHYIHLMRHEGEAFTEAMIVRGTLERLTPVMMTAVTSIVGLLPLLFGAGETGKEILNPLAIVVIGGMISSTLLDQFVTPALFFKFGIKVWSGERAAPPVLPTSPAPAVISEMREAPVG
jgi:CzcA family heavy metal efflux pump